MVQDADGQNCRCRLICRLNISSESTSAAACGRAFQGIQAGMVWSEEDQYDAHCINLKFFTMWIDIQDPSMGQWPTNDWRRRWWWWWTYRQLGHQYCAHFPEWVLLCFVIVEKLCLIKFNLAIHIGDSNICCFVCTCMRIMCFMFVCFSVNSEANARRIAFVEHCFGSSGQVTIYIIL